MKVSQILNNNVAVVKRGSQEVIVYSKGISFKKRPGDSIELSEIDKIVNQVIDYGETLLEEKMSDYLYLPLLDHVDFTIKRMKKGQFMRSPLSYEVKKFYPKHYQIGIYGIKLIKEKLKLDCPEDEAVAITLHFINIQTHNNMEESMLIMDTVKDLLAIIKYHFHTTFDEDSMNYMRLVTHIQYFAQRLVHKDFFVETDNSRIKRSDRCYS